MVSPHLFSVSLDSFDLAQNSDMPVIYLLIFNLWANFQLKLELESKFQVQISNFKLVN